jgi:serine phosphatase RsbU (regulator of sigma subunit)
LERLCEVVCQHRAQSSDAVKEAVVTDVRQHLGAHDVCDSITLVVVKPQ